jgi:gliding motility-associated-like protein
MDMRTRLQRFCSATALVVAATAMNAQSTVLSVEEYQQMKAGGTLPSAYTVRYSTLPAEGVKPAKGKPHSGGQPKGGGSNGFCNCWIEPDNDYALAMGPNDDFSSSLITLPFQFNLYGQLYTTCYINNNGNVSFDTPYGTFSASPFPTAGFAMVAPFWADVDTRGEDGNGLNGGTVKYKTTPTAMFVNWTDVGYYSMQTDKHNSFQLIITDGTDPVIGVGNNVAFCYRDMEWTTGAASQGVGGFGGIPSTVGANEGNGTDFIQFTRNDHDGVDYDGPFGNADGVSWLDYKSFRFTTAVSTQNIPPIINSNFLCDTVEVCMGELVNFNVTFLTPEEDQLIISTSATAPTIDNFASTVTNNGTNATINVQFIPLLADTGFHVVTFTGQDNGADSLESTVSIVLAVYYTPAPPPVITGDTIACEGQGVVLNAGSGYDDYIWTNGYFGPTVLVGPGSYMCLATSGNCRLASNQITVYGVPNPEPDITGQLFSCGGTPATLGTDEDYPQYLWSNGSTADVITVGTGSYFVTVTDANGCFANSDTVNVVSANDPAAGIGSNSPSSVFPPSSVTYYDISTIDGSTIVNSSWYIDSVPVAGSDSISFLFDTPGTYNIMLTVTTADGCTSTITYQQIVVPLEIEVPNVFSPNGDGQNDALVFTGAEYYPGNKLSVYNRWGQPIYETTSYRNNWRAPNVSEGTYFYVLKLPNGKEYTGHVTLLR